MKAFWIVMGGGGSLFAVSCLLSALGDAASLRSDAGVLGIFLFGLLALAIVAAVVGRLWKRHKDAGKPETTNP